jgi:hypothetical protein
MKTNQFYSLFLIGIMLIGICFFVDSAKADSEISWYCYDWKCCKSITIDKDQIPNTLVDFTVLINISSDSDLVGNTQSDGDDIVFVDSTNKTVLNYQIEYYDSATGNLVAWVKIPVLSSSVDTVIYMYYGNSLAGNQRDVVGSWNPFNRVVYHMDDLTTSSINDSTFFNIDGSKKGANEPIQSNGYLGYAQDFDGSNDYIGFSPGDFGTGKIFSISCWFKIDVDSNLVIVGGNANKYSPLIIYDASNDRIGGCSHASNSYIFTGVDSIELNTWYYVTYTVNNLVNSIYLNGNLANSASMAYSPYAWDSTIFIGKRASEIYFNGIIDEVRFSNTVFNISWVQGCYNNMNNATNNSFFVFGNQVYIPSTPYDFFAVSYPDYIFLEWQGVDGNAVVYRGTDDFDWDHSSTPIYNGTDLGFIDYDVVFGTQYFYLIWNFRNGSFSETYDMAYGKAIDYEYYFQVFEDNCSVDYTIEDYYYTMYLCHVVNITGVGTGGNTSVVWINGSDSNCSWNISYNLGNNTNTTNVSVNEDNFVLINGFRVDNDQLSIFLTLTLFIFFFGVGYRENKRSGGAFIILSGFCLLALESLTVLYLSVFFVIPLLTPICIFIIMLGIRKLFFKPKGEKTKSEGT